MNIVHKANYVHAKACDDQDTPILYRIVLDPHAKIKNQKIQSSDITAAAIAQSPSRPDLDDLP